MSQPLETGVRIAIFVAAVIGFRVYLKRKNPKQPSALVQPDNSKKKPALPKAPMDYQSIFDNPAKNARIKTLGKLQVPTGSIVACDGIVYNNAKPFAQKVARGEYEVSVLVSNEGTDSEPNERFAMAKLAISDKPAVRWEMAVVNPKEPFGYGVDAGVGSFMDEKTHQEYEAFADGLYKENPDSNLYDDFLEDKFEEGGQWANIVIPNTSHNVIIFSSGWGDGAYDSFWGYDADDNICALVTDFQVLGIEEEVESTAHNDSDSKCQLVLQLPASSIQDYDSVVQLEEKIEAALPKDATVDGHDMGSGEANIFIHTDNPVLTYGKIRVALHTQLEWKDIKVAYRELSGDTYTVLWPEDYTDFEVK
jgi:hypothetical protein